MVIIPLVLEGPTKFVRSLNGELKNLEVPERAIAELLLCFGGCSCSVCSS